MPRNHTNNNSIGYGLVPSELCRHIASLGHNELKLARQAQFPSPTAKPECIVNQTQQAHGRAIIFKAAWHITACVTLWRNVQTRCRDASPGTSIQKQKPMLFSIFPSCFNELLIFPLWFCEWIDYLQFAFSSLNFERWNSKYLPLFVTMGDNTLILAGCGVLRKNFMSF